MRIWVVPLNDAEAFEIVNLLKSKAERVLVSQQGWGATWAALEASVNFELESFRSQYSDGEIIGVELGGPNRFGARDLDHHLYDNADRRHPLSSLEQVAELLGLHLDRHQQLVAANDRGYIPAMQRLGANAAEISDVRAQDRRYQGLTEEDEAQAEQDLRSAEWRANRVLVRCAKRPTSAHSDTLFGKADEILLVSTDEWDYYGPRHQELAAMHFPEHFWSGGSEEGGYFGIKSPGEATRSKILQVFWRP
jgi:hypothetical protein